MEPSSSYEPLPASPPSVPLSSQRPRSLSTPLERLPGVGTARAQKLVKLQLATARDALMHFPREYRDFSGAHTLVDIREGEHASIAGEVKDVALRTTGAGRQMLSVLVAVVGGHVRAIWFNMPFMAKRFVIGMRIVIAGQAKKSGLNWEFSHPEVRWLAQDESANASEWLAVYPLAEGVHQSLVRTAVQAAIVHAADLPAEAFPEEILKAKSLLPIAAAIREIHCPSSHAMITMARRRFVYEELFMLQLALRMHRSQQQQQRLAPAIVIDARLDNRIRARFPFQFTPAQSRVCAEIAADLGRTEPMSRLLQGDVGSGKTAIAVYAMLATVGSKVPLSLEPAAAAGDAPDRYQAALMAPTELLARQHVATLEQMLSGKGVSVEVALLVGGQPAKQRERIVARIAAGQVGIVVGTQALVAGMAKFKHLGLVVIDEQHRFGVIQRSLLQQGQADPHTLVMTATPIPRTIAHAIYGDLAVSVLDEQPPGRQPVATYRVGPEQLDKWWAFFGKKVAEGRQGYVVVPAVEESKRDLASIASAFENLANGPLEAFRLGLVHGRLKAKAKAAVMDDFRAGNIDVLVATSVIEVGIDVPGATIMTILDAETFGLAQLHQLRGRVARGATQGICGAVTATINEPIPRIDAFVATSDGFKLAEQDLLLRGPGDLVGTRQSGAPPLYLADLLRDSSVVAEARRDAITLFESDPAITGPSWQRLRALILRRWGEKLGLGQIS
ncbi:MAG: ATP-dependent DNA helicase RecG [Planctomycetia bacterium]|nr:ATP-dependent DNA helicase RecG [Planctomycetia bacterium]